MNNVFAMLQKPQKAVIFFFVLFHLAVLDVSTTVADSISVTWIANSEPDLAGYLLYYGTSPGNYGPPIPIPAQSTSHEITNLSEGTLYYLALSAFDSSGNESEKSPEISGIAQPSTSSTSSSTTTTATPSYEGTEIDNNVILSGSVLPQEEDHFYIQVPPGQALLAVELTGTGDADLYVRFNQPPTQALWECRPFADNSNEYCTFDNPSPGTYYIMVVGYSGTSDYNLRAEFSVSSSTSSSITPPTTTTVMTESDTIPPAGTITINNGQAVTNVQSVMLQLSAVDNGIPLNKNGLMSFSNDNQVWSDPEPFTTEKVWALPSGDGIKTVFVLFCDSSGNWMTVPAQDDIFYEASQTSCSQTVKLSPVSISASSESLPFFAKENAIDGDPATAWSTVLRFFQRDEFLTIDLGGVKNITSLSMYASRMFGTDFFPTNFTIQVSSDNSNWIDMENCEGYSTPLGTSPSDNWNYDNLEARFLKISISKCRIFLLFFRVAQIAEIEVFGCEKTEQIPILDENSSTVAEEAEILQYSKEENDRKDSPRVQGNVLSVPGKPVITFYK
jgi:hypothetical protein